jgi:hypothetical protein
VNLRRRGGTAAVSVLVLFVAALAGCGTDRPPGAGGPSASKLGFTRYRNAVQWPAVDDYVPAGMGLRVLAPLGSCALGIGTYRNGYRDVTANWTGNASCTRLSINPAPGSGSDDRPEGPPSQTGGWTGGGVPGVAAVPWPDGSLLVVGTSVIRRDTQGNYQDLADLKLPQPVGSEGAETADQGQADDAIRVGNRLLISGGEYLNQVESPFLMASDDAGRTVRRVPLPTANGGQPRSPMGPMAADGNQVVAAGAAATNAFDDAPTGSVPIWHSADGGSHWTVTTLDGVPAGTRFNGVLHAGGTWFAVGGYHAGAKRTDMPLMFTSRDGVHWTRTDTKAMGSGAIMAATLDAGGRPVLLGRLTVPSNAHKKLVTFCGMVWLGSGAATGWQRGELDCDDAPGQALLTLSTGRVLIAGNRTLWISGAAKHD